MEYLQLSSARMLLLRSVVSPGKWLASQSIFFVLFRIVFERVTNPLVIFHVEYSPEGEIPSLKWAECLQMGLSFTPIFR